MTTANRKTVKPRITVSETDADKLARLAATMADRAPEVSESLLVELDRANVVADHKVPESVVRMGSAVAYEVAGGGSREVTIVYPGEADIALGKVSIMTPIGVALLGMSAGQSISWKARDGRENVLTVTEVHGVDVPVPASVMAMATA